MGQCKKIRMGGSTYYGTVSDGFTVSEVQKGADKLVSLFGMVGGFLGPEVGSLVSKCKGDYIADIKEQLLPRCDDKCQPMKQCKSSCKSIKSKCVPASLQSYFPMVKKGGSLRSMLPMIGLTEGSSEVRVIDAWLNKLEKCNTDDLSSSSNCLSSTYTGSACKPGKQVFDETKQEEKETKKKEKKPKKEEKETKKEEKEPKKEEKEPKKEEKEPKKEEESTSSVSPSGQCKKIRMGGSTYYGTVSEGFTVSDIKKGVNKLVSLFGMVGGLLGPEVGSLVSKCKEDYIADIKEQLLPRCDDKCQPMKQCKSSCKSIKSKCLPASLQSYFPLVKKGGALRSMLPMIGLTEGSSEVRVIDAWLNKLEKCNTDDLSSSSNCLSSTYTGSACKPGKQVFDEKKEDEKETKKEDEKETKKEEETETKEEDQKETKEE